MLENKADIGASIRNARKAKKMSAAELGQMLQPSVSHAAVCKWETGVNEPGITHLQQLGKILDLDLTEFFSSDRSLFDSEINYYIVRMNETQRDAVLGVARAMVEC